MCGSKQPAKVELACGRRAFYHGQGSVQWIRQNIERTLLASDPQVAAAFKASLTGHLWLMKAGRKWIIEARQRLVPTLASVGVPNSFVAQALCVHDGFLHSSVPPYAIVGDVLNTGEGSWTNVGSYGGGLQFLVGTWNRAAARNRAVPYAGSLSEIAAQPPMVQILAMWEIVRQDGGSFREWPNTGRACGLPM